MKNTKELVKIFKKINENSLKILKNTEKLMKKHERQILQGKSVKTLKTTPKNVEVVVKRYHSLPKKRTSVKVSS